MQNKKNQDLNKSDVEAATHKPPKGLILSSRQLNKFITRLKFHHSQEVTGMTR